MSDFVSGLPVRPMLEFCPPGPVRDVLLLKKALEGLRSTAGGRRGYAAIGLVNPKHECNVGGVLRAAGCYGAAMVAYTGRRYKNMASDTQKSWKHIPLLHCDDLRDMIPHGCVPVAVELVDGARPLFSYIHPERAFYIFGPEDSSVGRSTLSWCRDVVYIPTRFCMNLAATVNVVLYDRASKRGETNSDGANASGH